MKIIRGNNHLLYFIESSSVEDSKICFVNYWSVADLSICCVNSRSVAGWENEHLLKRKTGI